MNEIDSPGQDSRTRRVSAETPLPIAHFVVLSFLADDVAGSGDAARVTPNTLETRHAQTSRQCAACKGIVVCPLERDGRLAINTSGSGGPG